MPFYELLCIAKPTLGMANTRDLLKSSALKVLDRGGVVRGFSFFGTRSLPQRIKRHQEFFTEGKYWLMHFDCNPQTYSELSKNLRLDPRVLRHNFIKMKNPFKTFEYLNEKRTEGLSTSYTTSNPPSL
ncbi:hypothetical protein IWQ62_003367 [Dispira parvispora]|uniref:30S ribosomal protein S6 n=1 Tax=Dispira parvispora TaxID=1520584 RepID=A0A9W8AU61_9FUNG|nr:hypothetical protein IWQ62_003367 [Dispira parvispora]